MAIRHNYLLYLWAFINNKQLNTIFYPSLICDRRTSSNYLPHCRYVYGRKSVNDNNRTVYVVYTNARRSDCASVCMCLCVKCERVFVRVCVWTISKRIHYRVSAGNLGAIVNNNVMIVYAGPSLIDVVVSICILKPRALNFCFRLCIQLMNHRWKCL